MNVDVKGYQDAYMQLLEIHLPEINDLSRYSNRYSGKFDIETRMKGDWENVEIGWNGRPKKNNFLNTNKHYIKIIDYPFNNHEDHAVALIYDPQQLDDLKGPRFPFTNAEKVIKKALSDSFYRTYIDEIFEQNKGPFIISEIDYMTSGKKVKRYAITDLENNELDIDNPFSDLLEEVTIAYEKGSMLKEMLLIGAASAITGPMIFDVDTGPGIYDNLLMGIRFFMLGSLASISIDSAKYVLKGDWDKLKKSIFSTDLAGKVKKRYEDKSR